MASIGSVSSWEPTPEQRRRNLDLTGFTTHQRTTEEDQVGQPEDGNSYSGSLSPLYESGSFPQTQTVTIGAVTTGTVRAGDTTMPPSARTTETSASSSTAEERADTGFGIQGASRTASESTNETSASSDTDTGSSSAGEIYATTPAIDIPGPSKRNGANAIPSQKSKATTPARTPAASTGTTEISGTSRTSEASNVILPANDSNETHEIKVVIAGKSGAGKSALINNLLGKKEAVTKLCPNSTTDKLEEFRGRQGDVTICMVDTEGLKEDRKKKKKQLKELSDFTGGNADILIYCIPIAPGLRFFDANPPIMKVLQDVFGREIWDHCIVVFTFSNLAWEHILAEGNQEEEAVVHSYKEYIKSYAECFNKELVKLKVVNTQVLTIFEHHQHPRPNNIIAAVPAGYKVHDRVLADLGAGHQSWIDAIFLEMTEKCQKEHKTAFLQYRFGMELAEKVLGKNGLTVMLGGSGGGALVVAGTMVGVTVGIPGGPIGMALGGTIGATAGVVAGAMLSGGIAANKNKQY